MESSTLLAHMKNNTNQFQIYMINDVKFILIKYKLYFNTEWINKLKLNNKDKQLYV